MAQFIVVSFTLLVTALSLRGTGADHHCPSGWASYNEFCYMVYNRSMTWNNAERFCLQQETNCHLASIHSKPEAAFLVRLVYHRASAGSSVWIGLNDPEKRRAWQWSDGSSIKYRSWMPGEPDNHANNEYCVVLSVWSRYVRWNDQDCGSRHNFVCKFQPTTESNTVGVTKRK
uniref:C-type lectin galactose-binding isoform n=1 Tax=Pseudechis porphyriacus TaxID=8671 RepID=D2YVM0_PSEPO|nr:venom C-type lectin mannose binding isoform 3 variant 2 [Pseudechis porphyriacus]